MYSTRRNYNGVCNNRKLRWRCVDSHSRVVKTACVACPGPQITVCFSSTDALLQSAKGELLKYTTSYFRASVPLKSENCFVHHIIQMHPSASNDQDNENPNGIERGSSHPDDWTAKCLNSKELFVFGWMENPCLLMEVDTILNVSLRTTLVNNYSLREHWRTLWIRNLGKFNKFSQKKERSTRDMIQYIQ